MRDAGVPEQCCFCGRLSLGLSGQDFYLAPYFLGPDRSGTDDRYGQCHLRCLRESGLACRWASGVGDYFCRRWPDWTGVRGDAWRVHVSPPARTLILWSAHGWFAMLPFHALRAGEVPPAVGPPAEGRVLLGVSSTVGYEGGPYERIFAGLGGAPPDRIDLPTLLADLDSADRVLTPHVLRGGWVERVASEDRKVSLPAEYQARHAVELDADLVDACRLAVRASVGWRQRRRRG
ncbi:hypothetical protein [Micromonospora sp. NPDC085948]|uniref:hypothetical protein n=1 Tax=Micromonospora sp. NPDC085948 TaxID=3155293 RepID=UPI00342BC207